MVRPRLLVLILSIFFCQSCIEANADKGKESVINSCDNFMRTFQDNKFEEAIESLKKSSVIPDSTIESLKVTVRNQMASTAISYGKINAYQFVSEKSINNFLSRRAYVLLFDRYYLQFIFTIYKGNNGWTITNFDYNDDIKF